MSLGRRLWCAIAIAGFALGAAPVHAAPAEVELLKAYIGDWRGQGVMRGATSEIVICRLSVSQGNADKVNYSGRCTLAGSNLAIAGTMAYIAEKGRYEAVMSSNASFSGVAIGRKQEAGLVFNLKERDQSQGNDYTISATIYLAGSNIDVDFDIVDNKTGYMIHAEVPFTAQ